MLPAFFEPIPDRPVSRDRLHHLQQKPIGPAAAAHFQQELAGDRPRVQVVGLGNTAPRWRTLRFAQAIARRAVLERPTAILCAHGNFAPLALKLHQGLGIPYGLTAYGVEAWGEGPTQPWRRARWIWSISTYTGDRLVADRGVDPSRIALLPCTFAAERFAVGPKPPSLVERYGVGDGQVILTVARLAANERYKGVDRVLRVLPRLPNAYYLVAGKGDDLPRLQALAAELGVGDRVRFAGFVPDAELPDLYRLCDVFAMPSTGEGFGIVFLEALACGKPVVGGNRDGTTEALANGRLGTLIDPEDPEALTQAIATALQTVDAPEAPHQRRQRAIETFGPDRFRQRLAEICQNWL
ncbi:MAG: glycosyltransferase family 4 protein [Oscillatoriales cyanobacterium SM2_1_8]|nr:glycosyltransferase family 4 protein [Oscillatoriales cyanobacterium SM2_1_8]